ncbi:flagella accessory protein C [Methanocaldococcus indicus]|uniref:flagella accessory protein C n=1 Tax=Methanocaldococcus indicus TaxID=213231 RepID=UPI003C6D23E3
MERSIRDLMETTENLMNKLNDIESRLPRFESTLNSLRKENEMLRIEINKINENLQDIMALYEVVSNQINPFIGVSKITATSLEKLERLESEYKKLKSLVEELTNDLMVLGSLYLSQLNIDLNKIIEEVIEEEIIKSISGDEDDTESNE